MKKKLIDNTNIAVYKRAFSIWQRKPHQVAPIKDEWQTCQSCGTEFQGNFCPRCGQSASIGRFSFKKAFLLFLDIWGMGNRSMFRSIRDLMLRPGYMIRDYISGCQSAYFPPFKMFFILATFSLLLSHGFNFSTEEVQPNQKEQLPEDIMLNDKPLNNKVAKFAKVTVKTLSTFEEKNPSLFAFIVLILFSAPLYLFLRHSPLVPDLRFSEHVVALVYTSNMYSCFQLLAKLMPFGFLSFLIRLTAMIMIFVALSQLTGYSKKRLLWYFLLSFLLFFTIIVAIFELIMQCG